MKPIFLIGYMGCGKTTLGRALHKACGLEFIDLDTYIEARYRMNIRDIFSTKGQDTFRDLERRMLREVGEFEDVVIACGGGTPCFFDNMDYMNSRGVTVWLTASHERLLDRLVKGRYKRPLLADKTVREIDSIIRSALEERTPFYSRAMARFDSDLLENREQIDETVKRFRELMGLDPVTT